MPRIAVGTENDAPIEIHYEDHGSGQPVVLIHGYPLNGNSWERQERELLASGHRVISYDRRGFGRSSQPTVGYDYDTFAADLNALLEHLDLTDVVLVGFSMGTGEVTRYLGTYGSKRVRKAALLGTIPPFVLKTDDNPEGVDGQVFEGIKAAIVKDRYAYFEDFLNNFYNVDVLGGSRISDRAWQASFNVAAGASPFATYACVDTWLTDFRADLPKIDVPVLVVHGTEDRILPFDATAARLPALIADCTLVPVEGGPHNIGWTHPDEVNSALLEFIAAKVTVGRDPDVMEFLVEFEVEVPDGTSETEVEQRTRAESAAAAEARRGGPPRFGSGDRPQPRATQRRSACTAPTAEAELDALLRALPLADWLQVTVIPLAPHPNDPGRASDEPAARTSADAGLPPRSRARRAARRSAT